MGGFGYAGAKTNLIANRPTCGGDKKAGIPPRIGVPINVLMTTSLKSAHNCCHTGQKCAPPYLVRYAQPVQRKTLIY